MATIYLSSTYEDLKDYRRVVLDAIQMAGLQPIDMEHYSAADQRPVDRCLQDVEQADIYVGLFAFRYGYVPPPEHQNPNKFSITELEFRRAKEKKKPCLIFLLEEKEKPWPLEFVDTRTEKDKGRRIKTLRDYFRREYLIRFFSEPEDLAKLVLAALMKQLGTAPALPTVSCEEPDQQGTVIWDIKAQGSPYPGLRHFTDHYQSVFFGREPEVQELLGKLHRPEGRFLLVSGDSGVGKSSLIHAGILPKLKEGGLPGGKTATCFRLLAGTGVDSFQALMNQLQSDTLPSGLQVELEAIGKNRELWKSSTKLLRCLQILKKATGDGKEIVLFLDQMEEWFPPDNPTKFHVFLSVIYQAAQQNLLWVLATIRSDHLHHCYNHPELLALLSGGGHCPIGPIEPYRLWDMIKKPARCAGLHIADGLVSQLVDEMRNNPGSLPLLAFILENLYLRRRDGELSEAEYQKRGGLPGAIAAHATKVEAIVQQRFGRKTATLWPPLFRRLVKVDTNGVASRRRVLQTDLASTFNEVVEVLIEGRLLYSEQDNLSVTLSHEKLLDAWPQLQKYVTNNKKQLMDQTLLKVRAQKWAALGKPWTSGLATGREYHDFQQAGGNARGLVKEFLTASQRWRYLWMTGGAVVFLVIGGITWLWQKDYKVEQALLKIKTLFVSIHVPPEMVLIPGGKYQQGDVEGLGEERRNPVREVTIQPFVMGKHEVTFEEYDRFAIATGREIPGDQGWGRGLRPVINVSREDATAYAAWLFQQTGIRYRLPTESEWEYVARHANNQEVWAGTSDESRLDEYAVYQNNSGNRTAVVGSKTANGFGLNDLSGNVWEWVQDCWHKPYQGALRFDGGALGNIGEGTCDLRVLRGGSWGSNPKDLQVLDRTKHPFYYKFSSIGFRLAQDNP